VRKSRKLLIPRPDRILANDRSLLVQKHDFAPRAVPFDLQRRNDETYRNHFFGQGSFQLRLTHEGRRTLEDSPAQEASTDDFDDKMTMLLRARRFGPDLESAVRQAIGQRDPLSLLMIDIDHFKKVNDTHGHPMGDEVLCGCGELIARRVKGKGKAYRCGGEEVTVLLPNFSLREGLAVAEEIRAEVDRATLSSLQLHVTVSIGLACLPDHSSDTNELIALADKAMYQGKQLGRNLVRVSGESVEYNPVARNVSRQEPKSDNVARQNSKRSSKRAR
jgi:diguanylate cyclase (GGDEF)-like protein